MTAPIRVVLVEDNQVFREALQLLLGFRAEIEVVAAVSDGHDAVPACREHTPDVMLMDYRLPGLDGVQATAAVREACPGVAVVVLTAEVSRAELRALHAAGATECLRKDQDLEEIVAAVQRAVGRLAPAE